MAKTQSDIAAAIAAAEGLTKAQASRVVAAVLDEVSAALAAGEQVKLTGFGTFKVADRPARTGRNLRTGATIQIPAGKAPRFVAGKGLKDRVTGA